MRYHVKSKGGCAPIDRHQGAFTGWIQAALPRTTRRFGIPFPPDILQYPTTREPSKCPETIPRYGNYRHRNVRNLYPLSATEVFSANTEGIIQSHTSRSNIFNRDEPGVCFDIPMAKFQLSVLLYSRWRHGRLNFKYIFLVCHTHMCVVAALEFRGRSVLQGPLSGIYDIYLVFVAYHGPPGSLAMP